MFQKAMLSNTKVLKSNKPAAKKSSPGLPADAKSGYSLTAGNEKAMQAIASELNIGQGELVNLAVEMFIESAALLKSGK